MTEHDFKDKTDFRTLVLLKLENLSEKMDAIKIDLSDDIKTLFRLVTDRDKNCRATHDKLNKEISGIKIDNAVTANQSKRSVSHWERLGWVLFVAFVGLIIWGIKLAAVSSAVPKG